MKSSLLSQICDTSERLQILQRAINDIKKITSPRPSSKRIFISGPYLQQHYKVFCFLKVQAYQEKQALLRTGLGLLRSHKALAKQVADGSQSGGRVVRRMMRDEVSWVKYRTIKPIAQGKHKKVASMLDDENTLLAVREYISTSSQSKLIKFVEK